MNRTILFLFTALVSLSVLSGCTTTRTAADDDPDRQDLSIKTSSLPTIVKPYRRITSVLSCIKDHGFLEGVTFVVGPFADSTGKVNSVAAGSTGNYLPQGGSAAYITDALTKAGGRVVSTYFGKPRKPVRSHYAINGIFNSLDFGTKFKGDVRVGGVGPTVTSGWAQLTLTIQLDEVATHVNRQISMVERPVRYSAIGGGIGRTIGNQLVTGNWGFESQERLQFEALNGPIALGVANVILKEFPSAQQACESDIADLVNT